MEKRLAKEARSLVYEFVFLTLHVDEIYAQAWEDNSNSCRSMKSVGFELIRQEEREFKKHYAVFIENEYLLGKEVWLGRYE